MYALIIIFKVGQKLDAAGTRLYNQILVKVPGGHSTPYPDKNMYACMSPYPCAQSSITAANYLDLFV